MEKNQEINCAVKSCKYNDYSKGKCVLSQIQVDPTPQNDSQTAHESMCSSYNCKF